MGDGAVSIWTIKTCIDCDLVYPHTEGALQPVIKIAISFGKPVKGGYVYHGEIRVLRVL